MSDQFTSLGMILSEADCVNMGFLDAYQDVTESNRSEVYAAFVTYIPSLLLRPSSISEGGVSMSRAQRDDIVTFYSCECKRLGIRNELAPKVRFL